MNDKITGRIGWIGLGKMGSPMAANLIAAGYTLAVYNRTPDKAQPLVEAGATLASSVSELARDCNVVISMVADDAALLQMTTEAGGVLDQPRRGLVYVDMSTVSPAASERVARVAEEKGVDYLRAPVSGSTAAAAARGLTVFASGPKHAYAQAIPLLECLGKKLYYVGDAEQARYLKLAINMMVGMTAAMMGEALTLGSRGGVDWAQMIDIINNSAVASPLVGYKAQMLTERDFRPMFSTSQMAKDFDLALDAARKGNVPLPVTGVARQFLGAMIASGRGELDFFSYVTLMEDLAGLHHGAGCDCC